MTTGAPTQSYVLGPQRAKLQLSLYLRGGESGPAAPRAVVARSTP